MNKIFISLVLLLVSGSLFAIEVGSVPVAVSIENGKVAGGDWDSSMLKDKVHVLFYVDPDEKDKNEVFADELKKADFDESKYSPVAIINLAATWKPNVIIEALLKSKQKKFPNALYVKDREKTLVKKWDLADDESDILVFGKDGKLLFKKFGKLSKSEIKEVIELIRKNI